MNDPTYQTVTQLLAALDDRKLSSRELLDHLLARIERRNTALNAVVTLDAERARARADAADAARARGERWGPLHGLPMTVKDVFETEGLRTTSGSPDLADHVPAADAESVARLRTAGAVIFGKTNTPTLAADWQTDNPVFGRTANPRDPGRTPGGSSGGSAAALAAGLTPLELGSDIGGSIRIPSHFCGTTGHKPTWGIVPTRGHIPGPPGWRVEEDINVAGPMARSAAGCALALEVLAGPPADAAVAWRLSLPPARRERLADYRVAAWLDDAHCPVEPEVRTALEAAVDALRREGVRVDDTARPEIDLAESQDLYVRMVTPVLADALDPSLVEGLAGLTEPPPGVPPHLVAWARRARLPHAEWRALHDRREALRARWARFFRDWDAVLLPVAAFPAIPHDASQPVFDRRVPVVGGERPYMDIWSWVGPIGVALLPATVVPVGATPAGLPVGLQVAGPHLEDRTCLDLGGRLEGILGGFRPPPGF